VTAADPVQLAPPGARSSLRLASGVEAWVVRGVRPGPTVWAWAVRGEGDPSQAQALGELRDALDPASLRGAVGLLIDGPPPPYAREQYPWAAAIRALSSAAHAVVLLCSPAAGFQAAPHVELDVTDQAARRVARALGARYLAPATVRWDESVLRAPVAAWIDGECERLDRAVIDRATAALRSLLGALGATDDAVLEPDVRVVLKRRIAVEADCSGVAEPTVAPGELVHAGQRVAWLGEPGLGTRHALKAPADGVVLSVRSGRLSSGAVVELGRLRRTLERVADAERRPAPPFELGWCEWVSLPEIGVERLKAKIDTGARTSALHVIAMRRTGTSPAGRPLYDLELPAGRKNRVILTRAEVVDFTRVRDSGGHDERRPVIETLLELGPIVRPVRVSLTDRGDMLFPMLVGRTALPDEARVVPGARWLLGRP
jgi:hypothetical protein